MSNVGDWFKHTDGELYHCAELLPRKCYHCKKMFSPLSWECETVSGMKKRVKHEDRIMLSDLTGKYDSNNRELCSHECAVLAQDIIVAEIEHKRKIDLEIEEARKERAIKAHEAKKTEESAIEKAKQESFFICGDITLHDVISVERVCGGYNVLCGSGIRYGFPNSLCSYLEYRDPSEV